MQTNSPLVDDGPCSCGGPDNMKLEEVQLTSKLSGVKYDSIRCSNCQDVFAIEAVNDCECGGTDNGEHLNWCSESDVEWPPINATDNNPQLAD